MPPVTAVNGFSPRTTFGAQPFRCVFASPADSAMGSRYSEAKDLLAGAAQIKYATTSDLVVDGFQHLYLSEADDTGEKSRLFIVVDKNSVSATVAGMGEGVSETMLTIGRAVNDPREISADGSAPLIAEIIDKIYRFSHMKNTKIDEVVITGTSPRGVALTMAKLYEDRVKVTVHDDLLKRSMLVAAAHLAKLPEVSSRLLLTSTPNTWIGIVLSSDATFAEPAPITPVKYQPQMVPTLGPALFLFNDQHAQFRTAQIAAASDFIGFIEPFTSHPTRKVRKLSLANNLTHLTLAEHTARDMGKFHSIDIQRAFRTPPKEIEITVELDASLRLTMKVKDLASSQEVLFDSNAVK